MGLNWLIYFPIYKPCFQTLSIRNLNTRSPENTISMNCILKRLKSTFFLKWKKKKKLCVSNADFWWEKVTFRMKRTGRSKWIKSWDMKSVFNPFIIHFRVQWPTATLNFNALNSPRTFWDVSLKDTGVLILGENTYDIQYCF